MSITLYCCPILMKLEFSGQMFEKLSNIKFHENLSSGSPVGPRGRAGGRTDRHDEANSRFSQFCECAQNTAIRRCMSAHAHIAVFLVTLQRSTYVRGVK